MPKLGVEFTNFIDCVTAAMLLTTHVLAEREYYRDLAKRLAGPLPTKH